MARQEETVHFSWAGPEYEHHEKNRWWLFLFALVATGVVVYEINQQDWFGAVAMVFVLLAALWIAYRRPEVVDFELTDSGLSIANHHFPYQTMRLFWIVDNQHHRTLNFRTNHVWHNSLIIPLPEEVETDILRAFLGEIVAEETHNQPTFSQRMSRRLKL